MPIGVRLDPPHLTALAGTDVEGAVLLHNPGVRPVHVRLVIASEVAGWASIEPGELTLAPKADVACALRFRLPRGAPGGVGSVPFTIRVLSDEEGEGGAIGSGSLEVTGQAELAVRLLPPRLRGTLRATGRVAVDNLGDSPARVQLAVEGPGSARFEVEPDSFTVEPGGTELARVGVTPARRLLAGGPRTHPFRVCLDSLGGARITAEGQMAQRSVASGLLPKVAAGVVLVAMGALVLASGDGRDTGLTTGTTGRPATTTTAAPTTVAPPPDPGAEGGTPPPAAPAPRLIALQSKRDGNFEVYTLAADGSGARNLTAHPAHDSEPAWSPDRARIAFDSDREGGFDIFVMNADGAALTQLTSEPAPDGYPSWSPDGARIAFVSFRDGNSEIYVMNADGTDPRRLTRNGADDGRPAWSPDGTRIAFHTNRDGNFEIYTMTPEGEDPRNLTAGPGNDQNPAWSPNGARLAFDSTRDGGKPELYVMGADGSLPTRLTSNDDMDSWPAWSPDGDEVAFQSDAAADVDLYVMAVGGGRPRRLTHEPGIDGEPAW